MIFRKLDLFKKILTPSEILHEVAEIGKSCVNEFPEHLVFMGKIHGINLYGVPKDIEIPWINEVFTEKQINQIENFFNK